MELVENIIKRMKEGQDRISKDHRTDLELFDTRNKLKGLAEITRIEQLRKMLQFARTVNKEFDDVTTEDIEVFLSGLKVKQYTLENWKIILRKWYKNSPEIHDAECLKSAKNAYKFKKPSEMLNEKEVHHMIEVSIGNQAKAIIAVLWDCGIRVGELVGCNISDLVNRGEHLYLSVDGKTGIRELGLVTSASFMAKWLDEHPLREQPDKPLFISFNNARFHQRLTPGGVAEYVNKAKKKAGISKRVTPHIYRHSKATYLGRYMNESEMRQFFGWSRNSNMPSVYIHLTQTHVNEKRRAIETGEKHKIEPKPSMLMDIPCPRCGGKNTVTSKYCISCWMPLHESSVKRDIQILNTFRSPYVKKILGIDVENIVDDFYNWRKYVLDMTAFYRAFDSTMPIEVSSLRDKLGWNKSKFNRVIEILLDSKIITVEDGHVGIMTYADPDGNSKSVFDNFLMLQERYLSKT